MIDAASGDKALADLGEGLDLGENAGLELGEGDLEGKNDLGAPAGFDPLDPSVGGEGYDYEENELGLPIRHPIYGYYMGRPARKEREKRPEYVREGGYQGREERPEREAYTVNRDPRPVREEHIPNVRAYENYVPPTPAEQAA